MAVRRTKRGRRTKKQLMSKKKKMSKMKAGIPPYKKIAVRYNIVDVPFSKRRSKGTMATHAKIDFHYQKYSNVSNFIKNLKISEVDTSNMNDFLNLDINNIKKGVYHEYYYLRDYGKIIKGSVGKRFIPIILNLITDDGNHANILLIDKKTKLIELYEPHGARDSCSTLGGIAGAYNKKITAIRKFWRGILPTFKVINVVEYKRGTAFQMLRDPEDHTGYCVTWTILFIHYRLINKDVPLPALMKYISMRITTLKLLQYARYIEEDIKKKLKKGSKRKSKRKNQKKKY